MGDVIIAEHLGKRFRRYHADRPSTFQEILARGFRSLRSVEVFWGLDDVSFKVAAGSAFGVIGANGSGKSTLLRLLGGVGRAERGRVTVVGRIAALLDLGAGFHSDLTGRENLMVAGVLSGMTRRQVLSDSTRSSLLPRSGNSSITRSGRTAQGCRCGWLLPLRSILNLRFS